MGDNAGAEAAAGAAVRIALECGDAALCQACGMADETAAAPGEKE